MSTSSLSIGFGNIVIKERVLAVLTPDSLPIKRMIAGAESAGKLVNATMGKKTRAVLVMDDGVVVLSGISADTIIGRVDKQPI